MSMYAQTRATAAAGGRGRVLQVPADVAPGLPESVPGRSCKTKTRKERERSSRARGGMPKTDNGISVNSDIEKCIEVTYTARYFISNQELERPPSDRLFGQRVHSWVLVLPNPSGIPSTTSCKDVTKPIFIEPSTAVTYSPSDLLTANHYLGIESVWNEKNYWVNMQDCTEACKNLDWDLSNVELWEHLLAGEPEHMRQVDEDEGEEPNEDAVVRRNFHMVMPASYIDRIQIPFKGDLFIYGNA